MGGDENVAMMEEASEQAAADAPATPCISWRRRAPEWYRRLLQALMWARRVPGAAGYSRLLMRGSARKTGCATNRSVRVARLGNKRAFRLRNAAARMRWRWLSPLSLLARLRNAYVKLMLFASAKLASTSEGLGGACFTGPLLPSHPFIFPAHHHHHHHHYHHHLYTPPSLQHQPCQQAA